MANLRRFRATHDELFPARVILLGIEPVIDFDKRKEGVSDPQQLDKETGLRVWAASVMDLDPEQQAGTREIKVKMLAPVQPVPPTGVGEPVEFEGLEVVPYVNGGDNGRRARVAFSIRATGFRTSNGKQQAAKVA